MIALIYTHTDKLFCPKRISVQKTSKSTRIAKVLLRFMKYENRKKIETREAVDSFQRCRKDMRYTLGDLVKSINL